MPSAPTTIRGAKGGGGVARAAGIARSRRSSGFRRPSDDGHALDRDPPSACSAPAVRSQRPEAPDRAVPRSKPDRRAGERAVVAVGQPEAHVRAGCRDPHRGGRPGDRLEDVASGRPDGSERGHGLPASVNTPPACQRRPGYALENDDLPSRPRKQGCHDGAGEPATDHGNIEASGGALWLRSRSTVRRRPRSRSGGRTVPRNWAIGRSPAERRAAPARPRPVVYARRTDSGAS